MPKANPKLTAKGLINREALAFFRSKKRKQSFDYRDIWLYEHALAFTVAKMMDDDLLGETQNAITDAIKNGTDFNTFKKRLKPYLMARGWWGQQVMGDPQTGEIKKVQLGSTRRLKTIFHVNRRTAAAAGQWQRIQRNKAFMPYLKYIPSTARDKREAHKQHYNKILPVDDPFWSVYFPPNGYRCQCSVRQLSEKQAQREGGVTPSPKIKTVEYINKRTGEVSQVPEGVHPGFAHNHGDRLNAVSQLYAERMAHKEQISHVVALRKIHRRIDTYINTLVKRPNFTATMIPPLWLNPILRDRHRLDTVEYRERSAARKAPPSYFNDDVNLQALIYLYAGTGQQKGEIAIGQPGSQEVIELEHDIGYYVNKVNQTPLPTRKFIIIYSSSGAHIMPASPNK